MKIFKQLISLFIISIFILLSANIKAQNTKRAESSPASISTNPGYVIFPIKPSNGNNLADNVKPNENFTVISKYSKVAKGDIIIILNEKEQVVRISLPESYNGTGNSIGPIIDNCGCDKQTGMSLWRCLQDCLNDPVYYY